jgi:hypothetical protein
VVLWRFYSPPRGDHAEQLAAKIAGGLFFVLAGFVAAASVLTEVSMGRGADIVMQSFEAALHLYGK